MSRSNLPISSGNETSLLFEASSTSNDDSVHNETGNTDNWLRLKHTISAQCCYFFMPMNDGAWPLELSR